METGEDQNSSQPEEVVEMLPLGWTIIEENDRKIYVTPSPKSVKIDCRSRLKEFHRQGRFKEMEVDKLIFGKKRKKKTETFNLASKGTPFKDSFECVTPSKVSKVVEDNPITELEGSGEAFGLSLTVA